MRNIQGLRALAVIFVIAYHLDSDMFPYGYMGVDVFLVISGFLIGKKLLAIPLTEKWPFRFLMRRIFRIWPSLALVSVFTLSIAWFLFDTSSYKSALYSTLWALGGGVNFAIADSGAYFTSPSLANSMNHLWSISLEMQFYVFAAIIYFVARKKQTLLQLAWIGLGLLSFGYSIFMVDQDFAHAYHLLDSRFWEFAIGLTIANALQAGQLSAFAVSPKKTLFLQVTILSVSFLFFSSQVQWSPLNPILMTLLLLTILEISRDNTSNTPSRWSILENRTLVAMGDWSYATYLWHFPLTVIFMFLFRDIPGERVFVFALVIAISYSFAFLTTQYWEPNFTSLRSNMYLFAAIIFSLSLFGLSSESPLRVSMTGLSFSDIELEFGVNRGLNDSCDKFFDLQTDFCEKAQDSIEDSGDLETVVVWGDSHAMHLAQGIAASAGPGTKVIQFTRSLCAPIANVAWVDSERDEAWANSCMEHNQDVLDFLQESHEGTSVVLGFSIYNFSSSNQYVDIAGNIIDGKQALGEIKATLKNLQSMNVEYRVVLSPPRSGYNIGECLMRAKTIGRPTQECDFELDSDHRSTLLEPLSDLGRNGNFIDLADYICENGLCDASREGVSLYRDHGHLSKSGSRYLGKTYEWADGFSFR